MSGRCEICDATLKMGTGGHAIDHDHATGVLRGLLCALCNTGLGSFRDSPELLKRAAQYIVDAAKRDRRPLCDCGDPADAVHWTWIEGRPDVAEWGCRRHSRGTSGAYWRYLYGPQGLLSNQNEMNYLMDNKPECGRSMLKLMAHSGARP